MPELLAIECYYYFCTSSEWEPEQSWCTLSSVKHASDARPLHSNQVGILTFVSPPDPSAVEKVTDICFPKMRYPLWILGCLRTCQVPLNSAHPHLPCPMAWISSTSPSPSLPSVNVSLISVMTLGAPRFPPMALTLLMSSVPGRPPTVSALSSPKALPPDV